MGWDSVPQTYGRLGLVAQFWRGWLVRLTFVCYEWNGVWCSPFKGLVDGADTDVVLCVGPKVRQTALDRTPSKDDPVLAVLALVRQWHLQKLDNLVVNISRK